MGRGGLRQAPGRRLTVQLWSLLALLAVAPIGWPAQAPAAGVAQPSAFDDFARSYRAASPDARGDLVRALVDERHQRGGFPIVEPDGTSVVFVYLGDGTEKSVQLVGDFRTRTRRSVNWSTQGLPLERVDPAGSVFFARLRVEPDARLDYQFAIDGRYVPDVLNSRTIISGAAPSAGTSGDTASELVMPGYRIAPATLPRAGLPHGQSIVVDEPWATPAITIYLPPGYDPAAHRYPVVYTTDARQWRDIMGLPAILDNLIADGAIEPPIAVMIDSVADRGEWYQLGSAYLDYLARVVAYIDQRYATRARPEDRLHAGSSAGGRASLAVALGRPGLFARFAMFSPSLFASPHDYEALFTGRQRLDHRTQIFLSAGSYEGYILDDARLFERLLRRAGAHVRTVYTHEGHSFGTTRNLLPEMLAWAFPPPAAASHRR